MLETPISTSNHVKPHYMKCEEVRHRVAFHRFQHEVLRGGQRRDNLADSAKTILANSEVSARLDSYVAAVRSGSFDLAQRRSHLEKLLKRVTELHARRMPASHDIQYVQRPFVCATRDEPVLASMPHVGSRGPPDTYSQPKPTEAGALDLFVGLVATSDLAPFYWYNAAVVINVTTAQDGKVEAEEPGPSSRHERANLKRRRSSEYPRSAKRVKHDLVVRERIPAKRDDDPFKDMHELVKFVFYEGARIHALGISFCDNEVKFHYYDRVGMIYSTSLNLQTEASLFIEAIMDLSMCSSEQLGLNEMFKDPEYSPPPDSFGQVIGRRIRIEDSRYHLHRPIHRDSSLHGRATAVYLASQEEDIEDDSNEVILKFSWYNPDYKSEEEFVRHARAIGVQGVTELHGSETVSRLSKGVRGRVLGEYMDLKDDLELRIQVLGPVCLPLKTIRDIPTFKKTFVSLVKAHRDLFREAGIIHRDISLANLMVRASDWHDGHGVLIDLDFAAWSDAPNKFTAAATYAFRPIFLLRKDFVDSRHTYKVHYPWLDLESFFYCLLYFLAAQWTDGKTQNGQSYVWWNNYEAEDLNNSSDDDKSDASIGTRKLEFLGSTDLDDFPFIDGPEFSPAKLQKLRAMFARGYAAVPEESMRDDSLVTGFDTSAMSTMCGHVTYESFLAILEDDSPIPPPPPPTHEEVDAILNAAVAQAAAFAPAPALTIPTTIPPPPPAPLRRSKRLASAIGLSPIPPEPVRRSKRLVASPTPGPRRISRREPKRSRCSGRTVAGIRCKRTASALSPAIGAHGKHYCYAHRAQRNYPHRA